MSDRTPRNPALAVTATLLATLAAGVVWVLVRFWGANPEYADRFLILTAAGWAAWTARGDLARLPVRPAWAGTAVLLAGAVLFPPGWYLQASAAPRPDTTWWVTLAWVLSAAGVVLLLGGRHHLRRLAFPLVFVLFALPIPTLVLIPLQAVLQSATTAAAAAVLPVLGVPVERNGYVLSLPGGDLGVVEACSGVRSVTALAAIAAFVAYHQGLGLARGLVMLGLALPLIAGVNAVRVIVSGLLQEHVGSEYVRGSWHDALGVAMILLGLMIVVGLAKLMRPRSPAGPEPSAGEAPGATSVRRPAWPARLAVVVLAVTVTLSVVAQVLAVRAVVDDGVPDPALETIPLKLGPWNGTDMPVPDEIAQALNPDAIIHRVYDDFGYEAHVWVIYWSSRQMVKGYHHPDVCWPSRGFHLDNREVEVVCPAGGGKLPITTRVFSRGRERQLILYWTQEGRRVWTEEDERRAQDEAYDHSLLSERLFAKPKPAVGRLVVLVGTQTWGDGVEIRTRMLGLCRLLADEVYRICPWAAIQVGAGGGVIVQK